MQVVQGYNNFARGQIDHDMIGRYDLPIYKSASDLFENFFTNFKGNAIFRQGFEDTLGEAFQDCAFVEFKFSFSQNYLLCFYLNTIRFLSYDEDGNFGWVLSSGSPLEVTTTYTLDECKELQFTQNADVMVITHKGQNHAPKDLTRTSATSFTFVDHTFDADPFSGEDPACCLFYGGRLYFANTPSNPLKIWGSESGDYEVFTVPSSGLVDTDPLAFSLSDLTQPIEWLFGGENSMFAGCGDGVAAVNGGGAGVAITASSVEATVTSAEGCNGSYPFKKDGLMFYVGKNSRSMYYMSYDIITETFAAEDANFVSYDITRYGIGRVRHKKDKDDLVWGIRGDGRLLSMNFNKKEKIIGWHSHVTEGKVEQIAQITDNEGNPQLFALILRDAEYYIERLANRVEFSKRVDFRTDDKEADDEAYNRKIADELLGCIYLDSALTYDNLQTDNTITYDSGAGTIVDTDGVFTSGDVGKHISYKTDTGYESGRFEITGYTDANTVSVDVLQEPTDTTWDNWYLSFMSVSGLDKFNGETIGVVTDGGYLDDFEVSGGEIEFESQVLHAVFGYKYTGIIKSFCLGFEFQGDNTQGTVKAVSRVGFRCVASAGGQFGTSLYRLEPLQDLSQADLNYLPPLPIDGTKHIEYSDDNEEDKYFYIVQDKPLPFVVTLVMVDANYSTSR